MYQDKIDYLKRTIKRTYKRYTGERTDGEASLKDVANYFNIPIDESRLEDYSINRIDFNVPSIELADKQTNTTYNSAYTYNADLLNYSDGQVRFNSLLSVTPTHKIESLYYIGDESPIIEKMTFNDGEFDLVFEREFTNSVDLFINNGIQFAVRYLQQLNHNGRNVQQHLLTRIYKDSYRDGKHTDSFEQFYTYGINHYVKYKDTQDKYAYIKNNGVIYGINEFEQKDNHYILRGICFENTNVNLSDYFPLNMHPDNYSSLSDKKNTSAMIFNGFVGDCRHSIEIYKSDIAAHIKYYVEKRCFDTSNRDIIVNQELDLPLLNTGDISNEEVQIIINALNSQYSDDEFINLISSELSTFGKKIDVRKGIVEEENDMLSPKLFINQSFNEIAKLIDENKDEIFKLASEQFNAITSPTSEKGQTKVLKPKNN